MLLTCCPPHSAIAASLLPPVVNCGMNLAFAIAGAHHCGLGSGQFFRIAGISFGLYGINVACIYSVCLIFFYIKVCVRACMRA